MNRTQADEAITESFSRPSATPCTWRDDRDAYIAEMQKSLRLSQIDPLLVTVSAHAVFQSQSNADSFALDYFAIAHSEETWLLYCPRNGEFAKAFGSDATAPLLLLGFSSDDALAEWLG